MRVLTVIGNRPQFIKAAPLSSALARPGIDEVVVHTGQHYDAALSQVFFDELGIAEPDFRLDLRTADPDAMEAPIRRLLDETVPDLVLVYGDTHSTLAGGRAAVAAAIPLAHVEAGLRSGDLSMPEEHARIEVDRIASLLLCPDKRSAETLRQERVPGRIEIVGDVMADATVRFAPVARERVPPPHAPGSYLVATVHRAANVQPERLAHILDGFSRVRETIVFPAHPRTRQTIDQFSPRRSAQRRAPRATRLPRVRLCRVAGPRDPHRLGRPAEGGVLVRRAVRDDAPVDRVGRHGQGRCERPRRRRPRGDRSRRRHGDVPRGTPRSCTATAMRPSASRS